MAIPYFRTLALGLLLLLGFGSSEAAITCTISSPGFTLAYLANTTANAQTYYEVRCTRGLASDPVSVSFDVMVSNGVNAQGQNNQARATTFNHHIRYEHFLNACGALWKHNTKSTGTLAFSGSADMSTVTRQVPFWGCIVTAQTGMPSGTYTDQVTFTLTHTATANTAAIATGFTPVTIYAPASCTMSTGIAPVVFNYVAFGPEQTVTTNFGATCTNALPYTITLNATAGTITGLNYTLAAPASATGTGFEQTHTITGNMPAGQAGTCAGALCSGTLPHSVTITY
jgi:spore coat protein U-like protein